MPQQTETLSEIHDDAFWQQLNLWSRKLAPSTILEIGGGTGDGSTTAFFDAVGLGSSVYSIEALEARFAELRKKPVKALFGCSVSAGDYMSFWQVVRFYLTTKTNLNKVKLKTVLRWRRNELKVVRNIPQHVARGIDAEFVFIDGSPFTGEKEFEVTVEQNPNVRLVALDDINDIKNYRNYQTLRRSAAWECVWEDWNLRNGAAIFRKK